MRWLDDMNHALNYIEDNLHEKTDYEKIAKEACCSIYHFQRMFTFMTDITLSEYIRRRKMTLAALELQNSDIKIIDLALSYGYDSPEAFTRAFQNLHGITPTAARSLGAKIKAYPRITFQISVKGVSEMNYSIVEKEAFQVYGMEKLVETAEGQNLKEVPQMWLDAMESGEYQKLARSAGSPCVINSISNYRKVEGTKCPYMLCVVKTPLSDTTGYRVVDVPKATWAIFVNEPHGIEETSDATQDLLSRVYTEWLPTSGYQLVEGYDFEMYYSDFKGKFYEEIWIRVVKSN